MKQLSVLNLGFRPGQYVQLERVKKKGKYPKKLVEKACSITSLLEHLARRYPASSSAESKSKTLADEHTELQSITTFVLMCQEQKIFTASFGRQMTEK